MPSRGRALSKLGVSSLSRTGSNGADPSRPRADGRPYLRIAGSVLLTLLVSAALVFVVELIFRGSWDQTVLFFQQPFKPGWTTIILFALLIVFFDALLGRPYQALFVIAPVTILLAFVSHQKAYYLGDPLYPTDFLYARQIVELMPLLVRQRPLDAVLYAVAAAVAVGLFVVMWRLLCRHGRRISWKGRAVRLAFTLPALVFFVSIMDYATYSWARDRLQIIPMMWDQKENYNSNGFALAFALNVPMAKIGAPKGYSEEAIKAIGERPLPSFTAPDDRPDIIMVMSESFWDPTRLPGVSISPDPMPTVRKLQSGWVLSPEFGGMTANVEFEALTGFSNAFLPYGSIPYQQYVRAPMPTLATVLKDQGYATRSFHPFAGWFWNRTQVYSAFGFERFLSEEAMPPLAKRGPLASDAALTEEIIREAEQADAPFFFFAVTLQGHGPYEPHRYPDKTFTIGGELTQRSRDSLETYTVGVSDADKSLARLIDWASRRERPTIIAFFGDHLPPLSAVYVESGFMNAFVPDRNAPADTLARQHETPLVLWSSRGGPVKDVGAISPAFLPMQIMRMAGFEHPFYTGLLGEVHDRYSSVDRNMLIGADGSSVPAWSRAKEIDPLVRDQSLLQYDLLFGKRFGAERFFPKPPQASTVW
ncbi:MAG: LTA synthase family protein [Rhizobiaceae bacterium]|nr:LTA synthase family protein [Rhizobiaceae bacterium]